MRTGKVRAGHSVVLLLVAPLVLGMLLSVHISANLSQRRDSAAPAAQTKTNSPNRQILVLKDGTIENCSSYQTQGDRVRYYSLDRGEWEVIPAALVDWDATKKAQAEAKDAGKALDEKLKTEEAQTKIMPVEVDASLEVAPGVFLPPGEGAFLLDGHAIFPLTQSEASSKLNKGRAVERVLIPIPIIPSRHNIELKGAHAAFRIKNPMPEFYVRTSEPGQPDVELIAARVHGNSRKIANLDALFGQQQAERKSISLQEWNVAKGVYRFTLGQQLVPGEYVLAEFSARQGMNLYVWDFGVDPETDKSSTRKK